MGECDVPGCESGVFEEVLDFDVGGPDWAKSGDFANAVAVDAKVGVVW